MISSVFLSVFLLFCLAAMQIDTLERQKTTFRFAKMISDVHGIIVTRNNIVWKCEP